MQMRDQRLAQGQEQDAETHASIQVILQEASAAALDQDLPVKPDMYLHDDEGPGAPFFFLIYFYDICACHKVL